ncbi:hypothetical protein VNI00_013011 [Paramarasmius palmivorus]|uniref:Ribonuclease H1 N-terminal domain-containing protein n=1 Tax=Paramarasmius palmivorus TaxID=297713 RepID=A0AAW0BYN7_9AGAR
MEEVPGLVITTTTTIHRVHPDYPRPARPGPRSVSTVPDSMIIPTEEEEARGYCNRNGNLYLVVPPTTDNQANREVNVPSSTPPDANDSGVQVERSTSPPDFSDDDEGYDVGSMSDSISTVDSLPSTEPAPTVAPSVTATATPDVVPTVPATIPAPPVASSATPAAPATVPAAVASASNATIGHAQTSPPPPSSFTAPASVPEGTRFYVVYVGRQLGIFWGDWYQEVQRLVHGVSGHRSTKHQTFEQALVEYTRAYYGGKPGYQLRIVTDHST